MNNDLQDRIAVVTGSSRGIGLEIARTLGKAGCHVMLCARNRDELNRAKALLKTENISCETLACDLEKSTSARRVLQKTVKCWGHVDILVNNVGGIPKTGHFVDLLDEDWDSAYRLNLLTAVRFCREAIPYLKKSKAGRIINIASMVAAQPGSYNPHYSAMKAGILNLSKHLAGVLAEDGILVNSVSPGIIQTEGWDNYIRNKASQSGITETTCRRKENKRATKQVPLARLGKCSEVAELVCFLASDRASFITGTNHRVDGGRVNALL